MNEKITLQPFQESWAGDFEKEKKNLKKLFSDLDIEFYHIGSTSIPGAIAKPIVDILGVTPDVTAVDHYNDNMIKEGYKPFGEFGMRQRRFFQKPAINLHIFEDSDPEVERHLRFRDYLRKHPEKVVIYSHLKQELAKQYAHSRNHYTLHKSRFIKNVDREAAFEFSKPLIPKKIYPRKKNWTLDEIIQASEVNMQLHMTYLAKFLPIMEIVFQPDVTVVRSEIEDDTFNYVLFAKFEESNADNRIETVSNLYKEKNINFSWWVSETDSPSNLQKRLQKKGFQLKEENIGMYKAIDNQEIPSFSLHFQRVETESTLKDFATVITQIGGAPDIYEAIYKHIPPVLYQEGAPLEMFVGYLKDRPIITGILILHAKVAGIYYVACVPSERKKSFGTQMMKYLLRQAQIKGYFMATLQASREGKGLYESLGFQACSLFREYALSKKS